MEKALHIFNNARDAMLLMKIDGTIIQANPAAIKLYGYSLDELLKINIVKLRIFEGTAPPIFDAAYEKGVLFETIHMGKDGSLIPVEISSVKVPFDGVDVILSVIRDITDRKIAAAKQERAIRELNDAKDHLKVTLESIGDAVIATDKDSKITLMNAVSEELTGWSKLEALGRPLGDVFCTEQKGSEVTETSAHIALKTGKLINHVNHTVLVAKDGKRRIIADSAAPIVTTCGTIEGVVLVFRDVTRQQKAEMELVAKEQRYRATFENTGTAMIITGEDHIIQNINLQMEILSQYKRNEIEGKLSIFDFVTSEDKKRLLEYHKMRLSPQEGPAPNTYEVNFITKYQQRRSVLCTAQIIPGTTQSVVSFLDITTRKRAEEQALYLSYYDQVTKVYNRTYGERTLRELDKEGQMPLGIIFGDVNGLKLANDAFGHESGDQLLKIIACILQKCSGPKDILCRWGGDEFLIICPSSSKDKLHKMMDNIKNECLNTRSSGPIQPSIALGAALKRTVEENSLDVLNLAESRMYHAKLLEGKKHRDNLIATLEENLRQKDYETEEHARRLIHLSEDLGRIVGLTDTQIQELNLLAALHDIGKLGIPDEILNKPGPLTDREWHIMKRHSEIGYRIASSTPELAHIAESILSHHERWDGTGYPRGLKEEEIPLLSRIITIVDSYDVMTHARPYKSAKSKDEAIDELVACAGTQFDPELVKSFLSALAYDEE